MKKLLLISLLLTVAVIRGQSVYLDEFWIYDPIKDTNTLSQGVEYNDDMSLKYLIQYHSTGEEYKRYAFIEDTLVYDVVDSDTGYYEHSEDTIYYTFSSNTTWYLVDEKYQIKTWEWGPHLQVWQNNNLVERRDEDEVIESFYYSDYLNPYFNIYKTFKRDYSASHNYISKVGYAIPYTFEVVAAMYNYPTEVLFYRWNTHIKTYFFYYHVITNIVDVPLKPNTVISINYFDMMGRQIDKPIKGFYIERKVTDTGIVSTKHFVK